MSDKPMTVVTTTQIKKALVKRYPTGSHAIMWEVGDATGHQVKRHADAVAIGLWPSHGYPIEGIEIKVSRQDFKKEMKQPEKSQPIYQYCTRWWLAAPKNYIAPEELPPTWGLLELVGESLRVTKQAPVLEPRPISPAFFAALIKRLMQRWDDDVKQDSAITYLRISKDIEDKYRRIYEQKLKERITADTEFRAQLTHFQEATGIDLLHHSTYQNQEFLQRLKDFIQVYQAGGIYLADNLSHIQTSLDQVKFRVDTMLQHFKKGGTA